MQEEYGIKLKILTDGLKNSITQVKGMISNFKNDIKKDTENTEVSFKISDSLTLRQLEKLKDDIQNKLAEIRKINNLEGGWLGASENELRIIRNLEEGLKQVKDRISDIKNESSDTKEKISGISVSANMTNKTIVNGLKNSWKSIKKFGFALLSLRGIYGLVRKASSAYMAQDRGLAEQMQKTWASVGAMMAPIIETIVKWIRIGAAYLNYFIKALTGKDLIGKAVKKINKYNKSLGGTAKAAKSVNKELTAMDEVTNLSFDDASTDKIEDAAAGFDDFKDIKLDKNITKFLDDLAEKVKAVGKFLKPVIDWAIKNPGAIIAILGGAKLLSLLTKLVGGGGLLGTLSGVLLGIGVAAGSLYVIYDSLKKIKDANDELDKSLDNMYDIHKGNRENMQKTIDDVQTHIKKTKKRTEATDKYNQVLLDGNKRITEQIKATRGTYNGWTKLTGQYKKTDKTIKELTLKEKNNTDALYDNYKMGIMGADQQKDFQTYLEQQIKDYQELAVKTKKGSEENKYYNERLKELEKTLSDVSGKKYTPHVDIDDSQFFTKTKGVQNILDTFKNTTAKAKVEIDAQKEKEMKQKATDLANTLKNNVAKTFNATLNLGVGTKDAKNKVSNFVNKASSAMSFGGIINKVNQSVLKALLAAIPAYDVGTNYIPNDQLAMVHKGEAIVPKKFNNEQFFNSNNEETNALLVEVNQNLIELRNRPNVLEVNGKELAQATYNDFQNEGGRLNQSMTIKKVGGN